MTQASLAPEPQRYPLSFSQEWFVTLDNGGDSGAFGPRFLLVCEVRITGHVDLALLQGALDDVVARHELLRTLVVRDADPPYQEIYPPCRVPLEVRDLPPVTGKSRDIVAQELIAEAEAGRISALEVPTLRALLCRFDDRDSALVLTVHHSVSDGWSLQVILRDLGAFYAARRSGLPAKLPEVRQYREYAEWQKASATSTAEDGAPRYWQDKLRGGREFTIPNDHGHRDSYSSPYSLYNDTIDADVMSAASALATRARTTTFTVLLSAFYVLAHNITDATDLAIRAFTAGRNEEQFHDTMGLFINVLPFRTDLADCTSFRDILISAKETFIDALAHELPVTVIEEASPDFVKSREDLRTSQFIISETPTQLGDVVFSIAEGAREVHQYLLEESRHHDIPSGMVWGLTPTPAGGLTSGVLFNPDEFDESTVAGWAAGLRKILTSAVRDADQDWKTL
ncbi:MAG TPA: condensation domain-containing protein [Streptosporangiaceae bacterium]|nr:condensation domain-containing protein [Streptosporangiaceae bacterium]